MLNSDSTASNDPAFLRTLHNTAGRDISARAIDMEFSGAPRDWAEWKRRFSARIQLSGAGFILLLASVQGTVPLQWGQAPVPPQRPPSGVEEEESEAAEIRRAAQRAAQATRLKCGSMHYRR